MQGDDWGLEQDDFKAQLPLAHCWTFVNGETMAIAGTNTRKRTSRKLISKKTMGHPISPAIFARLDKDLQNLRIQTRVRAVFILG
jgi:hypothetical protein